MVQKTLEAFRYIPSEDRYRCYKYLKEKTLETINALNEEDKKLILDNEIPNLGNENKEKSKKNLENEDKEKSI